MLELRISRSSWKSGFCRRRSQFFAHPDQGAFYPLACYNLILILHGIQIPYPLETDEVSKEIELIVRYETDDGRHHKLQNASRRALDMWRKDAPSVGFPVPRSKAESEISSYAHTMIGSGTRDGSHSGKDHRLLCKNCRQVSSVMFSSYVLSADEKLNT